MLGTHFLAGLAACGVLALACSKDSIAQTPSDVEILWDAWGTPHIFAEDDAGLFRGFGWAQAALHGPLLLQLYAQARGQGALHYGQDLLASDEWVWRMDIPTRAAAWYRAQTPEFKALLDAFAEGINSYARCHPNQFDQTDKRILPIQGVDILAHQQRITQFTFLVNSGVLQAAQNSLESEQKVGFVPPDSKAGSNAIALAPSKTLSGHALLLINPHLPWGPDTQLTEAQLHRPGLNLSGVTLVGFPCLTMGFNEQLGWAHTVNTLDAVDHYLLSIERLSGTPESFRYRYDDQWRPLEQRSSTIEVLQPGGKITRQSFHSFESVHGPIVALNDVQAIALRVAGLDRPGALQQWWSMASSQSLREFQSALAQLQIPIFTTMYADVEGHILHQFGGLTPKRSDQQMDWSGFVPGDSLSLVWNDFHTISELPRVLDPASGWLQNCNDPPWNTTIPAALSKADYPAYMAPEFMQLRAQAAARNLSEKVTFSAEDLQALWANTEVELALRLLPSLFENEAPPTDPLLRRGWEVLKAWDRKVSQDSQGAVLFLVFAQFLGGGEDIFETGWDPKSPTSTPVGLANSARAMAALEQAVETVSRYSPNLDAEWGAVFRLQLGQYDLPCSGGMGQLGILRVFDFAPVSATSNRVVGGDSYVAVVEFGEQVQAQSILTYGNSSMPDSPHYGDQLTLASSSQLKPVIRDRAELEVICRSREWVPE